MQPFPLTFPIDAIGSADDLTLPQDFPGGICVIELRPPVGHAWTFTGINGVSNARATDEPVKLGPMWAQAGMKIGSASLDSQSGNLTGLAS